MQAKITPESMEWLKQLTIVHVVKLSLFSKDSYEIHYCWQGVLNWKHKNEWDYIVSSLDPC